MAVACGGPHTLEDRELFAWLQNFGRLVVRYERHPENFLGMLHLGHCMILLRYCETPSSIYVDEGLAKKSSADSAYGIASVNGSVP
jgi:hypothetical protein